MILDLITPTKIVRDDSGPYRVYITPGGRYPSVSTVLSKTADTGWLQEWKDKVGPEVAAEISKAATDRGTLIHENVENLILGKKLTFDMFQMTELDMFRQLVPVIQNISRVICLETQLYSDVLMCAGTVDLAGVYKDRLVVLDWKTASRSKRDVDITDYFLQTSCYAAILFDYKGFLIKDVVIAMTTEHDGLIVFEKKVKDYLPQFINRRKQFKILTGI